MRAAVPPPTVLACAVDRSYADTSLTPERIRKTIYLCRPHDIDTLSGADDIAAGRLRVSKL